LNSFWNLTLKSNTTQVSNRNLISPGDYGLKGELNETLSIHDSIHHILLYFLFPSSTDPSTTNSGTTYYVWKHCGDNG